MPPLKTFISYARKDESYKGELETHLSPLIQNQLIEYWSDRNILPSQEWEVEIKKNLLEADIAVFLVSADFMNSEYINNVELNEALIQYKNGKLLLIPIIIRPCDFQSFKSLRAFPTLPHNRKPISMWKNRDEAWVNIIANIKRLIQEQYFAYDIIGKRDRSSLVILYDINDSDQWKDLKIYFDPLVMFDGLKIFDIHNDNKLGVKTNQIESQIINTDYVLCLITPNFWTSCYLWVQKLIKLGYIAKIIPIKITQTPHFEKTILSSLKSYPSDNRFVSQWSLKERSAAFANIAENIGNICIP